MSYLFGLSGFVIVLFFFDLVGLLSFFLIACFKFLLFGFCVGCRLIILLCLVAVFWFFFDTMFAYFLLLA